MAASERRNGIGRCVEIQAVPADISAKRDREPAFFQRKGQRQRQRCERAGRKQRDRSLQSRTVVALG